MMSNRSRGLLAFALLTGTLTACSDTMGPDRNPAFDADAMLADYQAVDAVLASDGWKGFLAMGSAVSNGTFGAGIEATLSSVAALRSVRGTADARALALQLTGTPGAPLHAASAPVISPLHRGKTFVYDGELGRYVVDPDRTGAPGNGVRFIVYRDVGGRPDPAQETGYADLIDEGDGSVQDIALRLAVVQDGATILDYATTLDETDGTGTVTVDGFLRNGSDRLDFDVDVQGTGSGAVDIAFRMAVEERAFEILGTVAGAAQGGGSGDVDVTVRHGDASLRMDASATASSITGAAYVNGDPFVEISGDPDSPTFTRPGGGTLSRAEALLLYRVVDVVEDVFDLFEDLLDPIDELVILAVIL
ncbi:MAG: hypothetical protein PVH00_01340 [Gemmatimonadota bacterium]|jgi:hypothetical protein